MNTTSLSRVITAFTLALMFFGSNLGIIEAQDRELLEAAKKEGKVTIFGSLQDEVMKDIQSSFEKNIRASKASIGAPRPRR
jgi:hypothetical protein